MACPGPRSRDADSARSLLPAAGMRHPLAAGVGCRPGLPGDGHRVADVAIALKLFEHEVGHIVGSDLRAARQRIARLPRHRPRPGVSTMRAGRTIVHWVPLARTRTSMRRRSSSAAAARRRSLKIARPRGRCLAPVCRETDQPAYAVGGHGRKNVGHPLPVSLAAPVRVERKEHRLLVGKGVLEGERLQDVGADEAQLLAGLFRPCVRAYRGHAVASSKCPLRQPPTDEAVCSEDDRPHGSRVPRLHAERPTGPPRTGGPSVHGPAGNARRSGRRERRAHDRLALKPVGITVIDRGADRRSVESARRGSWNGSGGGPVGLSLVILGLV